MQQRKWFFFLGILYSIYLLSISYCNAQSLLKQRCLGGYLREEGNGIRETPDGGFIVCGDKESIDGDVTCGFTNPNGVGWLVKLNSSLDIEWQKCFEGDSISRAPLYCIDLTADKGYIIGGGFYDSGWGVTPCSSHGGTDYWVIKTDSLGNIQWQNCYGGSDQDYITDIHQTSDRGYILAGESQSSDGDVLGAHGGDDFWVLKLDSTGAIEWSRAFGGVSTEYCFSVVETDDNNFVACGVAAINSGDVSGTHGGSDYWVIKIDSIGNLVWQKALGGTSDDGASDVVATSGGGVIVMGGASSTDGDVSGNHGSWDCWVVQLDQNGNIVWQKAFGGTGDDSGYCMAKALDGGCILLSVSSSNDGDAACIDGNQFWFTKIDSVGNLQFQQCIGGSDIDIPNRVISTSDSGYAAIGRTYSTDGDVSGNHTPCPMGVSCQDFWVVKIGSATSGISETDDRNKSLQLVYNATENLLTANWKSNDKENLLLQIVDLTGRIIFSKPLYSQTGDNSFSTPFETNGNQLLLARLVGNHSSYTGRIVVN